MKRAVRTVAAALALLSACASPPSKNAPVVLSQEFYGTWANASPRFHQWWELSAAGAVNYSFEGDDGKCTTVQGLVLDTDQIQVQYGKSDTLTLHRASGDLLVFVTEGGGGVALHKGVEPSSICRRADGSYAEGAPHAAAPHAAAAH